MDNNNKPESFGTKLGRFVGYVLVSCVAILISALAIALTAKLIVGILTWFF